MSYFYNIKTKKISYTINYNKFMKISSTKIIYNKQNKLTIYFFFFFFIEQIKPVIKLKLLLIF